MMKYFFLFLFLSITTYSVAQNRLQKSNTLPSISSNFDDANGFGTIIVDLSNTDYVGPYHYQISNKPITELTEIYTLLEKITGKLDKAFFSRGNSTLNTHTFSNLSLGNYYVAVFDSKGERIYDNKIQLYPTNLLHLSNGINYKNGVLTSFKPNANSDLSYFLSSDQQASKLEFDLYDNINEQLFGYINTENKLTTINDLTYGFQVIDETIAIVVDGKTINREEPFDPHDNITLEKIDNNLLFYINEKLLHSTTLPQTSAYKTAVFMAKSGIQLIVNPIIYDLFIPYTFTSTINHAVCGEKEGSYFRFTLKRNGFGTGQPVNYTGNVFNEALSIAYSFNSTLPEGTTYSSNAQIIAGPGTYTLTGTIKQGNNTININETIEVGYYVETDDLINYNVSGLYDNNLSRNGTNVGTEFAAARSNNFIPENEAGWVKLTNEFGSNELSTRGFINLKSPAILDVNESSLSNPKFGIYKFGGSSYAILSEVTTTGVFNMIAYALLQNSATTQEIELRIDQANNIQVRQKLTNTYANLINYNLGTGAKKILFHSLYEKDGFRDIVSSYSCSLPQQPLSSLSYVTMKKKVRASYANTAEGKIKIAFDEAYQIENNQNITFSVRKNDNTNTTFQAPDYHQEDDNRYILDLSNLGLTQGDYYTLMVTISKNKTNYLRFKYND